MISVNTDECWPWSCCSLSLPLSLKISNSCGDFAGGIHCSHVCQRCHKCFLSLVCFWNQLPVLGRTHCCLLKTTQMKNVHSYNGAHTQMWSSEQAVIRCVCLSCQDWCFIAVFVPESAGLLGPLGQTLHQNTARVRKKRLACTFSPQLCLTHRTERPAHTH